jgi:uncharacterized membrane protein (Fun14 family)
VIDSLITPFEWVGRMAMDIGLGSVIDKFEEHWGKEATKFLLAVIGLAVICLCLGVVWSTVIKPLVQLVDEMFPDPGTPRARAIAKFGVFLALFMAGLNMVLHYVDRYIGARLRRQARERAIERIYSNALERKMLTLEQVDELRSLRD